MQVCVIEIYGARKHSFSEAASMTKLTFFVLSAYGELCEEATMPSPKRFPFDLSTLEKEGIFLNIAATEGIIDAHEYSN